VKPEVELVRLQRIAWVLIAMLLLVSAFQLRPYRFDTRDVGVSLEAFERDRIVLMNMGLVRIMILFPATMLAAAMARRFAVGSVAAFLLVGAAISGLAGIAQTLIGLPAEEYRPDHADSHSIEVIGDVLFWTHDNLVILGGLALFAGSFSFSVWMWKQRRRQWWVYPGLAALPLLALATLSWYLTDPADVTVAGRHTPTVASSIEAPWSSGFSGAALVCFVVWLAAMARWADRGEDSISES
jgi:hypothetical protein